MNARGFAAWCREIHAKLAILPRRLALLALAVMVVIVAASGYRLVQNWQWVKRDHLQAAWNVGLGVGDGFNNSIWPITLGLDDVLRGSEPDPASAAARTKTAAVLARSSDELYALAVTDAQGQVLRSSSSQIKPGSKLSGFAALKSRLASRPIAIGAPMTVGGERLLPVIQALEVPGEQPAFGVALVRLSYLEKNFIAQWSDLGYQIAVFEIGGPEILRNSAPPAGADMASAGRVLSAQLGGAESSSAITKSPIDHIARLALVTRMAGAHIGILVAIPEAVLWQSWWPQTIFNLCGTILLLTMMVTLCFALAGELRLRREAEAKSERLGAQYRLLAEYSSDALLEVRFDTGFSCASPATERMFGWGSDELVGRNPATMVHPDDLSSLSEAVDGLTPDCGPRIVRFRHLCKDGSYLWVEASVQLTSQAGVPAGFVAVLRDISERVESERLLAEAASELERLAATDQLTGLANRRRFDQELEREWYRASRENIPLSLVMFDIDFFKLHNDTYGHAAGDEVLQLVANTAVDSMHRLSDLVARWGGEEFVVLLPNTKLSGAIEVGERVRTVIEALSIPHRRAPNGRLTVSAGVATVYPSVNQSAKILIAEADANLYEAKRQGRNCVIARPSGALAALAVGHGSSDD